MRRCLLLVIVGLLTLTACSDDEANGSSGDRTAAPAGDADGSSDDADGDAESPGEPFCAALRELEDVSLIDFPTEDDLDAIDTLIAEAPDDLMVPLEQLRATVEVFTDPEADLEDLPTISAEDEAALNERMTAITDECGLDVPLFTDEEQQAAREDYDSDDLRSAIQADNPELAGDVNNISRFNSDITVQVGGLDDVGTADDACRAAAAYADSVGLDADIRIADTSDATLAECSSVG